MRGVNEWIARNWEMLSKLGQERALKKRAREANIDVVETDSESWQNCGYDQSDADSVATWPSYTLCVSIDGGDLGEVEGWHFVGHSSDRGRGLEFVTADDDGQSHGSCILQRFKDGQLTIRSGGECVGEVELPLIDTDGVAMIWDETQIETALSEAPSMDHGDEPTAEDVIEVSDRVAKRTLVEYWMADHVVDRDTMDRIGIEHTRYYGVDAYQLVVLDCDGDRVAVRGGAVFDSEDDAANSVDAVALCDLAVELGIEPGVDIGIGAYSAIVCTQEDHFDCVVCEEMARACACEDARRGHPRPSIAMWGRA